VREVLAIFHVEPEGCWAEVPDLPGFSAAGDSLAEVYGLVREGLVLNLDEQVEISVRFAEDAQISSGFWWSWSSKEYATVNNATQASTQAVGTLTPHGVVTPAGHTIAQRPGRQVAAG